MALDRARTLRGALAGTIAAAVWAVQQPLDRRMFGVASDDVALLGKAVTRGPAWPVAGGAMQLAKGAVLGAAYSNLAPRLPLPSWSRGPAVAVAAHVAAWPLTSITDRTHPAREELPKLSGSWTAFAQAMWRHLVFGVVLGEIERRLNPPLDEELPSYEHVVSTNGHGNIEHAAGISHTA